MGSLENDTNRFDGRDQFVGIPECFQDEQIDAAFLERLGLLAENFPDVLGGKFTNLADHAERPDRSRDQDVVLGGFASLAGDLHAAMIEFDDPLFHAECGQFVAVGAERIGFDDVRARFEIRHVNAEDFLGARGVQFVNAALRPEGFVQQRPHGPIGDEHPVAKSLFKFFDFHGRLCAPAFPAKTKGFSIHRGRTGFSLPGF